MEAVPQIDYLKQYAENRWFVLGAYFFAFFPWAIMSNVDFISEKWRSCRRTRRLAYIHFASSIFPIIYVAVYAEAQRRHGDEKELGAALAALMFNVFQLMRTMMGIVQLNAFVAWCKHAVECMHALSHGDRGSSEREGHGGRRSEGESRELNELSQVRRIVPWWQPVVERVTAFFGRYCGNIDDMEEVIEVNNTVVDNELGGREVTVLPSCKKIWNGLKKVSFKPSTWLETDQPMLTTVRWSGAFLCGMGGHWGISEHSFRRNGKLLETFFSNEMSRMREFLQFVDWKIEVENGSREIICINDLGDEFEVVDLTGEMCPAYGTDCRCSLTSTRDVDLYSFEFSSLVGSYPLREKESREGYRECVTVSLTHSVVLAKHLGVEKLKAIRRYYDEHRVPKGRTRENAFRLLLKQTNGRVPDDDLVWHVFRSDYYKIPLFPYRMQAVALWDDATNWRTLQASAHADMWLSLESCEFLKMGNEEEILGNASHERNIFDYCSEWTIEHNEKRGLLGVVMETIRTFLAEWIVASGCEPVWEPEIPTTCFEFDQCGNKVFYAPELENDWHLGKRRRLIWICQRELQRKVAQASSDDRNLPGNPALIMLFMLGFPFLRMEKLQEGEICAQERLEEVHGGSASASSDRDHTVDLSAHVWRVSTVIAPQDISLILQLDSTKGTVSLKLQNNSGEERFKWQDWVDAGMGCMKGAEEGAKGKWGYGRQVIRADLRKPIVELCPLHVNEDGLEAVVKKTKPARIWEGWPMFDVGICKFEIEQWLAACDVNVNRDMNFDERWKADKEVEDAESAIENIVWVEKEDVEGSTEDGEV